MRADKVKGLVPEKQEHPKGSNGCNYWEYAERDMYSKGERMCNCGASSHNDLIEDIENTDITNVDEFVELDVEKIEEVVDNYCVKQFEKGHNTMDLKQRDELVKLISTTKGVRKWRLEEKNEQVCPDCGGKVTDDGYNIDPDKCCGTCKMD